MLTPALVALAVSFVTGETNTNPWEEVSSSDGVTVYARDVPGARVREIRAEAIIAASPERVLEVLGDVEHYTEFMPYVEEARKVGVCDGGHYEYQRLDPPIVDRRDYVLKITTEKDAASGIYKRIWVEANDKGPAPRDGVVRVTINHGTWTISRRGNQAHIVYYLYTDPGGSIPAWLANKANTESVPALMTAVKNRAVNPSWKRDD